MKLNIANPSTGCQKLIEIDDDKKLNIFFEKRISQDVDATPLGEQFAGYVFRITGGNDKQGFPMMQGVLCNHRVRLLLDGSRGGFRPLRDGERRRKSVRGCIVGPDLSVLNLIIVKKGPEEISGLTDKSIPHRLGPKRATKIRKLFNLSKQDDVRQFVIRRTIPAKKDGGKPRTKAPKIQRLVTPVVLQRKRKRMAVKHKRWARAKEEAASYALLLAQRNKEQKEKRQALVARKRGIAKKTAKSLAGTQPTTKAVPKTK